MGYFFSAIFSLDNHVLEITTSSIMTAHGASNNFSVFFSKKV